MTSRTQTGILIGTCPECDKQHPITRSHCVTCGIPTLFLNRGGECLKCGHDQRFNTPEKGAESTIQEPMSAEIKRPRLRTGASPDTCSEEKG